jgi:hypothetical protein
MPELTIDKAALKRIVSELPKMGTEAEWCVACGASAKAQNLPYPEQIATEMGKQFLDPKTLKDFVGSMRAGSDWCVACGAGAQQSALGRIRPEEVTDEFIDGLAGRLIGAVKMG